MKSQEVRRRLTTKAVLVRGVDEEKYKNTRDSIMEQKTFLQTDTIGHDWNLKESSWREKVGTHQA